MQQQMSGLLRVLRIKQKSLQHVTFQTVGWQHLTQTITLFLNTSFFKNLGSQLHYTSLFCKIISSISCNVYVKVPSDIKL